MNLSFQCSNLWMLDMNYYDRTQARCGQLINAVTAVHLGSACVALLALLSDILQGTHFVAYAPLVWLCALACVAGRHQGDYRRARADFYGRNWATLSRYDVIGIQEALARRGVRLPEAAVAQEIVAYLQEGKNLDTESITSQAIFLDYVLRSDGLTPSLEGASGTVPTCACPL